MGKLFHRFSFTARLLLASGCVAVLLLGIDYVTLLELPRRVATDSVEVALRENTQSFNAAIVEERQRLDDAMESFVAEAEIARAVRAEDLALVEQKLTEHGYDDVKVAFIERGTLSGLGLGAVATTRSIDLRTQRSVVFYQEITNRVLDRAAADSGHLVAFAVELDGRYVARSNGFDRSIKPNDVNVGSEDGAVELTEVTIDGVRRHVYSRRLSQDSAYQVAALSSAELEQDALGATRSDVRTALLGMTIATLAGLLLVAIFTSRSVGRFAARVREITQGDYRNRLPVHGRDGFAELASSVNVLSAELEARMTQLEATATAFRRTLETIEDGICTWTEAGEISFWNRGAEQLTGIVRERATLEDPIVAFLHAERTPGVRRVNLPVRRSGVGGLVVDLVVTAMPGGGVLQTFRDTSTADALQQTQRDFMATAAHELRTPITTILGFADTLANPDLELTEKQRTEFVAIVREQSHHLQELADAFFTNHQLANERVEVTLGPTVLVQSVADAIERLRIAQPQLGEILDGVEVEVPGELMPIADRRALVGVISVLVENAAKYGGAPIRVTGERSGGAIVLLVTDHGPGMDPYHQSRVFDPFYRIDVDMRSGVGGAGLGLFTARKLVEAMRGSIRVRSTPGSGTTFFVELPSAPSAPGSGTQDDASGRLRLVG